MSKHTPGPWAVNPIRAMVDAIDSNGPSPICGMLWFTETRSEEETEANADLIAAAPDLLEALQEVAPLGDIAEGLAPYYIHSDTIKRIRAALAKADPSGPKEEG
jgi:hypothetical protein